MIVQTTGINHLKVIGGTKRVATVLLVIYLLALNWILLFKLGVRFSYMKNRSVNLIPFREILLLNGRIDVSQIILNVVVFIPLGIYAGILFERWKFRKKLLFFFLISLIIEGLQYGLAVGAFDSTDIITNTSGGVIGYLLYKAIEKAFNNRVKAQKFITGLAAIGTALILLFLVLLKLNMLPVRYQ